MGNGAKTLLPDIDMEPASYVVTGSGPRGGSFEVSTEGTVVEIPGLDFGDWSVTVYARNAEGVVIAKKTQSVAVHAGQTVSAIFIVTPLEGFGSLSLTVRWNKEDTENPRVEGELIPAEGPALPLPFAVSNGDTGRFGSDTIPTGYHTLAFQLLDSGIVTIGAVEVVRVVKDQLTTGDFEFPEINRAGGAVEVNITPDMADPIEVTIHDQREVIRFGESMMCRASVPAGVSNVVYVWYINGESQSTGQSYEVRGLDVGIYRLDVTAFTTDGSRAGSASHLFHVTEEFDNSYITDHIWSPDGSRLAFVKAAPGRTWNCDLWVADRDLSNARLIYTGVGAYRLEDWQGDWILFQIDREEGLPSYYYGGGEFWKIRPDGTGLSQVTWTFRNGIRRVFWNHAYDNIGTAVWAAFVPGTNLVYFRAHDGNGWYRTYLCDDSSSFWWRHVSYPDFSWRSALSPTGDRLLYGSSMNYYLPMTIKAVRVDLSGLTVLKRDMRQTSFIVLSDGAHVSWGLDGDIYAIGIDGSGEAAVTQDSYSNSLANSYPGNGQQLLMTSNREDGNYHVFSVGLSGAPIVQMTFGAFSDSAPAISRDGQYLAYRRLPEGYSGTAPHPYELVVKPLP
jgi:Tol biopolymer transport system component